MKRLFGGVMLLGGAAVTGLSAYSVLFTHTRLFGQEPAYVGAAGLALLTFGILSSQK